MISVPVEARLTEYLHRKAALTGIPLSGTFELTPCCNMDCKMCYVRLTKSQQEAIAPLLTAQQWLELGCAAKKQGMIYLLLTGGEPFLRPDFRQILQGLHWEGLVISVNTNGTLINEDTVNWLRQTPPARMNITLYGASDATYERLCGNPKGFTQVTNAIRLLKDAGIGVRLNCSVTPYNAGDLEDIFAFAKAEGLLIQATSYMFPPLRKNFASVGKNDRFSPEDAAYYAAKVVSLLNGEQAFLEHMEKQELPALPPDMGEDCPEMGEGEKLRCRAGKCSFWVTWEGKLLPCGMFPAAFAADVRKQSFTEAWQQIREGTQNLRLPPKCTSCAALESCRICAAMAYTESGNFHTAPSYRCEMSRAYPAACLRLRDEILTRKAETSHG